MQFKTETGSTYEVDTEAKRIRRVTGYTQHTKRFEPYGEWKTYKDLSDITVGDCAIIYWGDDVAPLIPGTHPAAKTTITSVVTEITA